MDCTISHIRLHLSVHTVSSLTFLVPITRKAHLSICPASLLIILLVFRKSLYPYHRPHHHPSNGWHQDPKVAAILPTWNTEKAKYTSTKTQQLAHLASYYITTKRNYPPSCSA